MERNIEKIQQPKCAAALFAGWEETLIWSCLQGVMGNVYGDHPEHPASASAVLGDFCFLAGKPSHALAAFRPEGSIRDFMIMIPQNDAWSRVIQECWKEKAQRVTRYAFKKNPVVFDRQKLLETVSRLPEEYEIRPIDRELYSRCRDREWSRDLAGQYENFAEYERLGLGFAVLKDNEVIAGASSYSSYREGIEIQIDTRKDHRRKGLARVCGSALILECLDRGLYPGWDAQNRESAALARQLGYEPDHPYTAYEIRGYCIV